MEGKSKLGSRTLGAVEVSVATISQGCARTGQHAYTPMDRDPGEKRTLYLQMFPRMRISQRYT